MVLKYKSARIPADLYEAMLIKKRKIEQRIKEVHHKEVNIKLVDVQRYFIKQPRFEWDDKILPFFLKQGAKKKFNGEII